MGCCHWVWGYTFPLFHPFDNIPILFWSFIILYNGGCSLGFYDIRFIILSENIFFSCLDIYDFSESKNEDFSLYDYPNDIKKLFDKHLFLTKDEALSMFILNENLKLFLLSLENYLKTVFVYQPLKEVLNSVFENLNNEKLLKEQLYVVLFDHGVIKVGKGVDAKKRVQDHAKQARVFSRKIKSFFIEENPQITERELICFCKQHGSLFDGNEYFKNLKYQDVVAFVKRQVKRKVLK